MEENKKYVYLFQEGNAKMKDILGGKGANLAEMTNLGLPIPQGFTISAECCNKYYEDGEKISEDIISQIEKALGKLEEMSGKKFGDVQKPLLVSVRSGARVSMPGMMDTILNLGINDETVKTLAAKNRRFAYDSYRRFIQMYSDVVKGIPNSVYEKAIDTKKMQRGLAQDIDMDANDLEDLVKVFKGIYYNQTGSAFPQDVKALLLECIEAVFKSWNNPRAIKYRRLNDIPGDWGTAVNIQMMVFGNMGDDCGTGVAFSRNPATGENKIYGEFLMNAQGEDVVAGIRTPMTIDKLAELNADVYNEFVRSAKKLEKHYKDMQDLEFTIEHGNLYILQTRNGKRTAQAALQVAVDLVKEGLIDEREAVLRVEPKQLEQLLHPNFDKEKLKYPEWAVFVFIIGIVAFFVNVVIGFIAVLIGGSVLFAIYSENSKVVKKLTIWMNNGEGYSLSSENIEFLYKVADAIEYCMNNNNGYCQIDFKANDITDCNFTIGNYNSVQ